MQNGYHHQSSQNGHGHSNGHDHDSNGFDSGQGSSLEREYSNGNDDGQYRYANPPSMMNGNPQQQQQQSILLQCAIPAAATTGHDERWSRHASLSAQEWRQPRSDRQSRVSRISLRAVQEARSAAGSTIPAQWHAPPSSMNIESVLNQISLYCMCQSSLLFAAKPPISSMQISE